ncbi:MAG: hypothetical protein IAI49_12110 [Candidatus Eremiobacteraeota bacterium]|nr:hypothetical protein [Candidatus Eremiobacteraeota bacterium]
MKAEAAKVRRRRFGFFEVGRVAEHLVRVDHDQRIEAGDVGLSACTRRRLGTNDVERLQVEKNRPPVVEAMCDADQIRETLPESVFGGGVTLVRDAEHVEERMVEIPAVHRFVAHVVFGLLVTERLAGQPAHDRA